MDCLKPNFRTLAKGEGKLKQFLSEVFGYWASHCKDTDYLFLSQLNIAKLKYRLKIIKHNQTVRLNVKGKHVNYN